MVLLGNSPAPTPGAPVVSHRHVAAAVAVLTSQPWLDDRVLGAAALPRSGTVADHDLVAAYATRPDVTAEAVLDNLETHGG